MNSTESGNFPWDGVLSEIILFNRALSSSEMAQMSTYLQSFYGIATTANASEDAIMTAYIARLTTLGYTLPSTLWRTKMNNFWARQRTNGNLALLDRFGCFQTETENPALVDMIDPSVSLSLISTPSWNIRGYTGNGSTHALDPNWIPSNGVSFLQDSALIGAYGRKLAVDAGVILGARDVTGNTKLYPRWTDGKIYGGINQVLGTTATETNYSGFGVSYIRRGNSTAETVGIENDPLKTSASASVTRPTVELRLLCNNNNGANAEFYSGQISNWFAGGNGIDVDAIVVDYKTFEAGIGILS